MPDRTSTMRICIKCKTDKSLDNYSKNSRHQDHISKVCKDCHRKEDRESYKKHSKSRRQAIKTKTEFVMNWFRTFKSSLKCSNCPETHYATLQFHHTDPSKKDMNVSNMRYYSIETIKKEIEKCIVLCANCHAKEHWKLKNR